MSESVQFWLTFTVGLVVSVAGIIIGIRAEARNQRRSSVGVIIALGGVMMIAAAKLWRDPEMPALRVTALTLLLLGVCFFMIWLTILRQPIHKEKDYNDVIHGR